MSWMPTLFVVDAGPEIGGGHVMRSLTLARALADRGAAPAFLAPPYVSQMLNRFGPNFQRVEAADAGLPALREAAAKVADSFDAVVFDHFGLGAPAHQALAPSQVSLAIDELADRKLGVNMLLDVGPDRRALQYEKLLDPHARLLLGPAYALVRPEFAEARASRPKAGPTGRILVSLGLTDVGGITARVVNRLLPRLDNRALDVVVGQGAPSLPELERLAERDPRVCLHVDSQAMAGLYAAAEICIGAGGSSSWERCTVGVPTVLLVLADNQAPGAAALASAGAAEVVDVRTDSFEADFDRAALGLLRSPERRARMGAAAARLCDGQGAGRVAEAFLDMARGMIRR